MFARVVRGRAGASSNGGHARQCNLTGGGIGDSNVVAATALQPTSPVTTTPPTGNHGTTANSRKAAMSVKYETPPLAAPGAGKVKRERSENDGDTSEGCKHFRGVTERKSSKHPFVARCRFGGSRHHLGSFSTAIEAAHAYDAFALAHGKTLLNFGPAESAGKARADEQSDARSGIKLLKSTADDDDDDGSTSADIDVTTPTPRASTSTPKFALGPLLAQSRLAPRNRRKGGEPASTQPATRLLPVQQPAAACGTEPQRGEQDRISSYRGVRYDGRNRRAAWSARITIDGTKHYIGPFDTELEAAREFDRFCLARDRGAPNFGDTWRHVMATSPLTGREVDLGWAFDAEEEKEKLAKFEADILAKVQTSKRDKVAAAALQRMSTSTWSD